MTTQGYFIFGRGVWYAFLYVSVFGVPVVWRHMDTFIDFFWTLKRGCSVVYPAGRLVPLVRLLIGSRQGWPVYSWVTRAPDVSLCRDLKRSDRMYLPRPSWSYCQLYSYDLFLGHDDDRKKKKCFFYTQNVLYTLLITQYFNEITRRWSRNFFFFFFGLTS